MGLPRAVLALAIATVAGCGRFGFDGELASAPEADADPFAPDADPFAPDADPFAPDADPLAPDAQFGLLDGATASLCDPPCTLTQHCETALGDCTGPGTCVANPTDPPLCQDIVNPVCGCDGTTYVNACYAAGAPLRHLGACGLES